jgi:tripartite-type tricarboxylate transporter receptor subunit TctC
MTKISRRAFIAATAGAMTGPVFAQSVSTTTITVPFAPGGSVDALARMIQPSLEASLGRKVLVENKSGGAGALGAAQVAKAPADGSSLLLTFDSHATIPALMANPPLDVEKDMVPILLVGTAPYVLICSAKHNFKTIADVIAADKANPGSLRYGSAGPGTIGHLSMLLLCSKTGMTMAHIPYRGGALAINDVLGGHIDLVCASAAVITPQLSSPNIRPILQFGDKRLDSFAGVQTIVEAGYPALQAYAWWGIFAPKGISPALQNDLSNKIKDVIKVPSVTNRLKETQQMTVVLSGPAEMQKFFTAQIKLWGDVIRDNKITL